MTDKKRRRRPEQTPYGHGTLVPAVDGRCGVCGGSGFVYSNGFEFSKCGMRGYRCLQCGSVKPERVGGGK